jgi:hypothetical protein
MDTTLLTTLAALGGSLVGGGTTMATAWLSQRYGARSKRLREEITRRESLYGAFIDEASRRIIDAIEHEIDDASQVVPLFALFCRIQLVCSPAVLHAAERVVRTTAEIYANPSIRLKDLMVAQKIGSGSGDDGVAAFSRACRDELEGLKRQL